MSDFRKVSVIMLVKKLNKGIIENCNVYRDFFGSINNSWKGDIITELSKEPEKYSA